MLMYQRRTVVWNTLYHGQLSASLSRLLRSATNNTLPTSKGQIDGTNSVTISAIPAAKRFNLFKLLQITKNSLRRKL